MTDPTVAQGVVTFFDAEQGWGVISSPEPPASGQIWVHFSHIVDMPGYRALDQGDRVEFGFERFRQDSYDMRATWVRKLPR